MHEIYSALTQGLATDQEISIKLLPEDQLLVSKHLVSDPSSGTFKTPRLVPAANGYEIYARIAPPGAKARPQQRPTHPTEAVPSDHSTIKLQLDHESLDQNWELLNAGGERISIAAHCGSVEVFDEVDRILAMIGRFLKAAKDR